jgi:NADH-quinone oxidoreductase subunit E
MQVPCWLTAGLHRDKILAIMATVERIVQRHEETKGSLIPVLQEIQEEYGYISSEAVGTVSKILGISESQIYGVLTFYSQFYLHPRGRHVIKACCGTACHVRGANRIAERVEKSLNVREGETTPDTLFSYERIACMGSCGLAPVVRIDKSIYGMATPDRIEKLIKRILKEEKNKKCRPKQGK